MVYAATPSESQKVIHWKIVIEDFGPNIQHMAGVENIVSDKIIRMSSLPNYWDDTSTRNPQCRENDSFVNSVEQSNYGVFILDILLVKIKQQKYIRKINPILSTYTHNRISGYSKQYLENST